MMTGHLIGSAGILRNRILCEQAIRATIAGDQSASDLRTTIRQQVSSELAGFVITVADLQAKAARKLQAPDDTPRIWWVTEKSLQQSTPWQVARLKSMWFADETVFDLCCGHGGDARQLKQRGPVVAIDADPLVAELAAANLDLDQVSLLNANCIQADHSDAGATSLTLPHGQVICADVARVQLPQDSWISLDPDRRPSSPANGSTQHGSTRTIQPDHYQPDWQTVLQIIRRSAGASIKLAPAANPAVDQLPEFHRCWISLSGSVREQTLLSGGTVTNSRLPVAGRSAAVVKSNGTAHWFIAEPDVIATRAPMTNKPLAWIVDPDAAIRAAGLTEAYAVKNQLSLLGRASGFLTGAAAPIKPNLAMSAEVIWSGSCDDRKLRRELRQRNFYPAVIKVRGTDHNPEQLTRKYRKCGEQPVCLWIGRGKDRVFAAITQQPQTCPPASS